MSAAPRNLADAEFWETDYLGDVQLPSRPDPSVGFERSLMDGLASHAPVAEGSTVLELGCAPGTWLVFYAEHFGARPAGIEYTEHGVELTRRNLAAAGIEGDVLHGDVFEVSAPPADLVLSLGFIEHFDDLETAFARHVHFLAPGGTLVVGVPNYLGVLGSIQRLTDPSHLALHNLDAMVPATHRELGAAHGLSVAWQGYLNGPDPALLKLGRRWVLPAIVGLEQLRRVDASRSWNRPRLSSYLLTVLRRPAAPVS